MAYAQLQFFRQSLWSTVLPFGHFDMEENGHLAISRGEDSNLNSKPPQALIVHCKPLLSNLRQKP
jgi:hypothetical protein